MNVLIKPSWIFVALIIGIGLAVKPAHSHSFKAALLISSPPTGADQARHIQKSFMRATAERDGHPDQESSGYLGGLYVYVSVILGSGDFTDAKKNADRGGVNIVAAFGLKKISTALLKFLNGNGIALLVQGRPSSHAAQGYATARRIDLAVRSQGDIDNLELLWRSFNKTEHNFTW